VKLEDPDRRLAHVGKRSAARYPRAMPSPVGHALAGLVLVAALAPKARGRATAAAAVLAVGASLAPDLDFLPGLLLDDPGRFHHGASHSVGAAVLGAVAGYALARMLPRLGLRPAQAAVIAGLCVLGHAVLDLFAVDTSIPYGVMLWWPLDTRYVISPWTPFLDIQREQSGTAAFFRTLATWHNVQAMLIEAIVFGPALAIARWRRRLAR
jgi:inner membrane protein